MTEVIDMQTALNAARAGEANGGGAHDARKYRHRRTLVAAESFVAVAGMAGSVQLMAGVATPPTSDLPFGLSSWVLPGLWLFSTVSVPAAVAAVLAYRRSPRAPLAVLVAAATMTVEVIVQIPFIGPNPLQLVFGGVAVALGALALHARTAGWRAVR